MFSLGWMALFSTFAQQKHLIEIFFDIVKAYNTTWKFGILQSIHSYGIHGSLAYFIRNFFQNHTFLVSVADVNRQSFPKNKAYLNAACLAVCCSELQCMK